MKKYILFLLLSFQSVVAQVQFEAKVSRQSVGLNETLRIDFIMNADGDNFAPPSFDGFRVVGGPSQQVSQSWVNGKSSFNKIYSYFLMPEQRGTIVIKQASIEINGQIYKTTPLKVNVGAPVERQRDPNDTSPAGSDDIHLVAEISKSNPYINEPITVVYKLYCGFNIGISNWQELDKPKYNDFWSQNLDVPQKISEGDYNGERYRYVILKKVVLYPQKSGQLTIEPLSLNVAVEMPSGRRDFFGRQQVVQSNKRISAGAKTINVKSLPQTGRPDDFSGAVGKFSFKVVPSKSTLKEGESFDVAVSVNGTGNLKLFDIPKPVVPTALEMYDPVRKENVKTNSNVMSGSITETYAVVAGFKGNYTINPLSFSYFDPSQGKYKTINSDALQIRVLDGVGAAKDPIADNNQIQKKTVEASDQFRFIKLKTHLLPIKRDDFLGSTLFYSLLILPFLAIPLLILLRRKKDAMAGDIAGNRTRMSNRLAKKYLSEAKKQIANKELFYVALEKAMHNFLKAKLEIETSEMSKEKISELLLSRNADAQSVSEFINLTENCELARYAPASTVSIQHDFDKAVSIISSLEKQLN